MKPSIHVSNELQEDEAKEHLDKRSVKERRAAKG
jgi:hypothetical protein